MPPSTISSIFNAISSPDPRCENSSPMLPSNGKALSQPHDSWPVLALDAYLLRCRDKAVLSAERDHDGRVFRALALVNRRRIGQHQLMEFAKAVGEISAIEVDGELAFLHVDARHDAEVAVVDLLVIVVLDLHDLISWTEGPAETLDADLTGRVTRRLQLDIEGAGTEATPVHRAEHLDVAYGIEPEALRDAFPHDRQQLSHPLVRVGRIDEEEVTAFDRREIGHQALIDAMGIDDDPALSGLSEDLGQAHNRHGP